MSRRERLVLWFWFKRFEFDDVGNLTIQLRWRFLQGRIATAIETALIRDMGAA